MTSKFVNLAGIDVNTSAETHSWSGEEGWLATTWKVKTLTPLHCCCAGKEDLEVLEFLLDHKADVNAMHDGQSPLHLALRSEKSADFIRLLVENGAGKTF